MNPGKKILIAEDEPDLIKVLQKRVSAAGYDTILAADGRKALELFDSRKPDLVLLDVMMPGMDGWELIRYIKDIRRSRSPVLVLTAKTGEKDKMIGVDILKADAYMTKPFDPDELIKKIRELAG